MKFDLYTLFSLLPFVNGHKHRCTAQDACWPTVDEWNDFNSSVNGRLLSSRPTAHVCHGIEYNNALCEIAKAKWASSDWRVAQPGGYSAILWELGQDQCFIDSAVSDPCQQGLVADYTVNASSIDDIRKAVRWASKKNLLFTVKNTGHDHLGRSSGKAAFAIWTHHLKGRTWHDSFVPRGARKNEVGVPAVTLEAGEQWLDIYRDADQKKRIVVGGSARTVGAAGGWFTGGGHSAWSYFYGLGVDSKHDYPTDTSARVLTPSQMFSKSTSLPHRARPRLSTNTPTPTTSGLSVGAAVILGESSLLSRIRHTLCPHTSRL